MLAATVRILPSCLRRLVLVHQIEVHVVDHRLLLAHMARSWRLYRPEAATTNLVMNRVVHTGAMLHSIHLLLPRTSSALARRHLLTHLFVVTAGSVTGHVIICHSISARVSVRRREERAGIAFGAHSLVLSVVEGRILRIMRARGTRRHTRHMRRVGCIAVLSFDWLHCRVVQVNHQVFVYRVFVWRFGVSDGLHDLVHPSGLCPTVVCSDPVVLTVLLVVLRIYTFVWARVVLDGIIINGVVTDLVNVLHW